MKNIIRKNKSNAHFLEHTRRFHGPSYRNTQAWKIACDIEAMVMLVDAVSHAHRYYCRSGQPHDQDPLAREIIRLAGQMQHLRHFNQEYPHCQYHPYVSLFMDCVYRHLYEQGRFIFDHPYGSFYGHHWQFKVFIDTLRSELRTQSMVLRVKPLFSKPMMTVRWRAGPSKSRVGTAYWCWICWTLSLKTLTKCSKTLQPGSAC